jgi:hypothetical protein
VKRLWIYVLTLALTCAVAAVLARVAAHHPHFAGSPVAVNNSADAAFRDGLFQGRLDAERSRRQHLSIGRWSVDADRRSFVSGYLQAYREMYARGASGSPQAWQPAEQRGFRDGMADGLRQGGESKRAQPAATENYKRAAWGYSGSDGDLNQYKRLYREAYCTGYHQGYYGELEKMETAKFSPVSEPE